MGNELMSRLFRSRGPGRFPVPGRPSPVLPFPHASSARSNYALILALWPAALVGCIAYGFGPEAAQSLGIGVGLRSQVLTFLVRELGAPPAVLSTTGAVGA